MNFGPYSFENGGRPRGVLRQLAIPMIVAATLASGLFAAGIYWKSRPETKPKSQWADWVVTWVELSNFKKPEAPAQKEQK
jgi:hypothetical protein